MTENEKAWLSYEQRLAIEDRTPQKLIVAPPGSGKTRTLVASVQYELERGLDPERCAVITYTNQAATELVARTLCFCGGKRPGFIGTLHSFCLDRLRAWGAPWTVLTEDQAKQRLDAEAARLRYKGTKKDVEEALKRGWMVEVVSKASAVARAYQMANAVDGVLDFDQVLQVFMSVAKDHGWECGIDHLWVDEVQDAATPDQVIYLGMVCKSKVLVGDPAQSIYSFRGGNLGLVNHVKEAPDWKVLALRTNYRSGWAIINRANLLLGKMDLAAMEAREYASPGSTKVVNTEGMVDELTQVVAWVQYLLEDGTVPSNEVAVLCRSNYLAGLVREALQDEVEVAKDSGEDLPFDWPKLVAAFNWVASGTNWAGLEWLRLSKGDAEALQVRSRMAVEMQDVDQYVAKGYLGQDPFALLDHLEQSGQFSDDTLQLADDVLTGFDVREGLAMAAQLISTVGSPVESGRQLPGVHVGTMHGAKGREWSHVLLPFACDEVIPGRKKNLNEEEERRLFFVAVTRARDSVRVSTPRRACLNAWHNEELPVTPSRYLGEWQETCWR